MNNQILKINAAGLEYGLRNKRDGYCFFGTKKEYVINLPIKIKIIKLLKNYIKLLNEKKSFIIYLFI